MRKKVKLLLGLEAATGGALKHVFYLSSNLNKDTFDITVLLSPRDITATLEIEKIMASGVNVVVMRMPTAISVFKDLYCLLKVFFFIFRHKFDIIHSHSSKAGFYFRIAGWLNRIPVNVYTPHCFYFQSKTGVKRSIFSFAERLLALFANKIVVSNNEWFHCLDAKVASDSKLVNINNAINFQDYSQFDRDVALNLIGIPDNAVVIGTVGRLVEQKDLSTFIEAARHLLSKHLNVYFVIAGSGELENYLISKVKEYRISEKVLFVGHHHNIGKIFSAIDIFVSTSLWEGLPYALLEAMWFKKPIVATNLGYGDIFFDEQNGYLIQSGDVRMLCKKLDKLIEDQALCVKIGERNHIRVAANHSFKEFVKAHEKLYLELLCSMTGNLNESEVPMNCQSVKDSID